MVRQKNRYIIVSIKEADKEDNVSLILRTTSLHSVIQAKVQQLYGDFGVAAIRAGFTAKYCNEKTRIAIIRVRHGPHRFVTSSLPCINKIENKHVVLNSLYVGATIRQCFKFLLAYQQKKFDEFCVNLKTDEEKVALRDAIMNLEVVKKIT